MVEGSDVCRNGISNIEFNKLLEQMGFSRVRVRSRSLMGYALCEINLHTEQVKLFHHPIPKAVNLSVLCSNKSSVFSYMGGSEIGINFTAQLGHRCSTRDAG
jgi:hypothetical protein